MHVLCNAQVKGKTCLMLMNIHSLSFDYKIYFDINL